MHNRSDLTVHPVEALTATAVGVVADAYVPTHLITTSGAGGLGIVTVEDGTVDGQRLMFLVVAVADPNDSLSIQPTSLVGGGTLDFDVPSVSDGVALIWSESLGEWEIGWRFGCTHSAVDGFVAVAFDITGQAVGAAATWTKSVPLGRSDLTYGHCAMHIPQSVGTTDRRGRAALLFFSRTVSECRSRAEKRHTFSVRGYPSGIQYSTTIWETVGYLYSVDGFLSASYYNSSGHPIRIESAVINGSDVDISFKNTGSANGTLNILGEVRALRAA